LESQLPKYYSNPALTFLVASLLTPVQLPALYDDKESIIDFLGSGEPAKSLLELDRNGLKLLLLFSYGRLCGDQYRSFFTSYLHAPARSGQNVFDGKRYTVAALECLKYLHQDRDRNTPTTGNPIPKLFPWALQCLPILLDRAAITGALVQSVRRHRFSQRSKEFSNDESAAKLGISRLLLRKPRTFIHDLLPNSK
jgi:hypothetical protein